MCGCHLCSGHHEFPMMDCPFWNCEPTSTSPPLSCFCKVFCHSDENSNQYTPDVYYIILMLSLSLFLWGGTVRSSPHLIIDRWKNKRTNENKQTESQEEFNIFLAGWLVVDQNVKVEFKCWDSFKCSTAGPAELPWMSSCYKTLGMGSFPRWAP